MKSFLQKLSLLMCLTSLAYARNESCCPTPCPSDSPGEPCCLTNINCQTMCSAYTATARIHLPNQWVYSIWGDFIYWQPRQDNMDVAFEVFNAIGSNAVDGLSWNSGRMANMNTAFKPGFKVGAGWAFDYDNWDVALEYTRLHANTHVTSTASPGGFLFERWANNDLINSTGLNNSVNNLSDTWNLHFDHVTLEFARRGFIGTRLVFSPFVGLAMPWIRQKFTGSMDFLTTPFHLNIFHKSHAWGIGPRLGFETDWYYGKHFSLIAKLGADIMYTRYHLTFDQTASDNPTIFAHSNNRFNTMRPELDAYVGFHWEGYTHCSQFHYSLELGYQYQVWFNQNMMRWYNDSLTTSAPIGNLYFQGITFSVRGDF